MRKIVSACRLVKRFFLTFGLLSIGLSPASALADNLLGDSSFDLSSIPGAFPNSGFWSPDAIGEAGAVLDGAGSRSGPYSLHLYTGAQGPHYLTRPRQIDLPAIPGRSYHAGGYFQTRPGFAWQNGSAAMFRVGFLNSTNTELAHHDSPSYAAANTNWSLYEVMTPAAPAGTTKVRFTIYLTKPIGISGQSIVNADDLFLEELPAAPALEVAPKRLPFGASNDSLKLLITNSGGGVLDWVIEPSPAPWLTILPPTSGSTTPDQPDEVEVVVDRTDLDEGDFTAMLTVIPTGGSATLIPVEMRVGTTVPNLPSLVSVDQRRLMVQRRRPNGSLEAPIPYRIKSFAWSPASFDTTSNFASRRQAFQDWYAVDLGMIRGANANTVYTFLDFGLNPAEYLPVLDSAYQNGIMVIMTVDEDGSYNLARAEAVVAAYRNHPAILMWAIGNEWNINRFHNHFSTLQAAAQAAETLAQLIASWDADHPVATIYGEISIAGQVPDTTEIVTNLCPSIEVWGLNIYRGQLFYNLFDQWAAITDKPMFLSEFGIDSMHTTQYAPNPIAGYLDETEQADWNHSLWSDLQAELSADDPMKVCLGGSFFAYVDEWWKVAPAGAQNAGGFYTGWNPSAFPDSFANEEYFGSVKIDGARRIPKATYYRTHTDFGNPTPTLIPSPTNLAFGLSTAPQNLTIQNAGNGVLNWAILPTEPWLSVIPSAADTLTSSDVAVSVDRTGLAAGDYSAALEISSNGGSESVAITMAVATSDDLLFIDAFESGDTSNWSETFP